MARFKLKRRAVVPSSPRRATAVVPTFLPHIPSPSEDANAAIHELLTGREFTSAGDLNAHLQQLLASGEVNRLMNDPEDPRSRARMLGAEALRTRGTKAGEDCARRALELDPECTDAHLALVPSLHPEGIPRLREIVEMARRRLAPEVFERDRGSFWGIHATRPFIRALQHLATSAFLLADYDTVAVACQEILSLNREDNLGVRELLLAVYLRRAEREQARELIARFEGASSTPWNWLNLLFASRFEPGRAVRLDRLQDAATANPHVLERLLGMAKIGKLDMQAAAGSPEDANNAMVLIRAAIEKEPEVYMKWLIEEIQAVDKAEGSAAPIQ